MRMALRNFATSRMRAFLSILGIVIGVASVIAITTLGRSATVSIQTEIARSGLGTLVVQGQRSNDPRMARLYTPELAADLKRQVAGIQAVSPLHVRSALMRYADRRHRGSVLALTEETQGLFDLRMSEGRYLSTEDLGRRRSVVVLGAEAARVLFPTKSALGEHVRLYLDSVRSFKVIGVIDSRPDALGLSFDMSVCVPLSTYSSRIQPLRSVQRYAVGVQDAADVVRVTRAVTEFFRALTGGTTDFRVLSPSAVSELFDAVTSTLNAFLTAIAAISLIVGGVGIMNIMLGAGTERTKEVGIRKALGATPGAIRGQFLTEAVTLTLVGGALGRVRGTALSWWGTWLLGWNFAPNPGAYPLALAFASGVGICFGLYPAIRASRLDPVQALAYE